MVPPYASSCGFASYNTFPQSFGLMSRFEGCNDNNNTTNHHHHHHHHQFALEDEPRTSNSLNETGSSSKDVLIHQDPPDKGWLRLSIGAAKTPDTHNGPQPHHHHPTPFAFGLTTTTELDLLPPGGGRSGVPDYSQAAAEVNWTFTAHNSSSFIPFGPYFSRPLQLHTGLDLVAGAPAGPSSHTLTVIDPPRRPHSGIWFSLQPLELNQGNHPALPHTPSSYLRIKDGRMTVRLLIKYLVKKLRLDTESQIEIRCRGEKLEGWLTMQHIRDNIWFSKHYYSSPRLTLLPHSSTIDHIMVLHYATPP